ncbi:hypothetical protein RCL1_003653 [Eukaryota sp. TZLM3-RCL]
MSSSNAPSKTSPNDNGQAWLKLHQKNTKMISLMRLELTRAKTELEHTLNRNAELERALLIAETEKETIRSLFNTFTPAMHTLVEHYIESITNVKPPRSPVLPSPSTSPKRKERASSPSLVGLEADFVLVGSPLPNNQHENIGISNTSIERLTHEPDVDVLPLETSVEENSLESNKEGESTMEPPKIQMSRTPLQTKVQTEIDPKSRPKRRAAPTSLQEPSLKKKLRKGDPISFDLMSFTRPISTSENKENENDGLWD